ncbi:MAG: hypothetical protein QM302_06030 [Acidobacteriota bacterium]|nr:hypothetical protein [Acidobacteriota bacterium]
MGLLEALRGRKGEPSLYRRAWSQTDDPLVAEARAQTLAIQRLQLWLRLAYSALALAALLGYWGFAGGGGMVAGTGGVVLGVLSLICVLVLRTGISNGRRNVGAMLDVMEASREDHRQGAVPTP